ncbi:hypothetical protein ABNQ39_32120 [Azospirillum sp. A26]|uniref:hypothetical protein n=1 Tax=Azospirillum sp. A26 TaxID=3160607 RepID=UPI00366F20C0
MSSVGIAEPVDHHADGGDGDQVLALKANQRGEAENETAAAPGWCGGRFGTV